MDATDYIVSADRKYICFESNFSKVIKHFTVMPMLYSCNASSYIFDDEITLF